MKLYWALVLPVLMYGSECWTLRKEDERRLLVAEMAWLRRIRGRSRRERIRNEKTREELAAVETVIEKIKRRRLTWFEPFLVVFMVLSNLKTATEFSKMAAVKKDSKFTRRSWAS